MKIVIFSRYPRSSNNPKGGVESVTVVLANALANQEEMDVHVITLEKDSVSEEIGRVNNLTIHRLPASGWPQMLDIMCGPAKKRLINKIKKIKPDIVHSHETFGLTLGQIGIPHVFTVHGFDHANIIAQGSKFGIARSVLWAQIEKYGLGRHKRIISISPYVKKMITPLTKAKIYDIDNPVEEEFFKIDNQTIKGRILCVGWIDERKNTIGSTKAFASLFHSGIEGKLVIAGEAKKIAYKEKLLSVINNERITHNVELLGHIDREQLKSELSKASVLLLPSLQENAPMVISEAMAAGVPVITSNRCGMPYMVDEGKSGFLIDPDNPREIVDRLKSVIQSEKLQELMGKEGRKIAYERFHPDKVARLTIKAYREMLSENAL